MSHLVCVLLAFALASCASSCKPRQKKSASNANPQVTMTDFMLKAKDLASKQHAEALWVIDSYSGWSDVGGDIIMRTSQGYFHAHRGHNSETVSELKAIDLSEESKLFLAKLSDTKGFASETFDGIEYKVYIEEKGQPAQSFHWNNPAEDSVYVEYVQLFKDLRKTEE
jgi:hypothetical protein